ncbi:glycoside hydrolase family 3 C-terminal domain-containing protein [Flammeovirga pacifica]|uniref:Glycosyl hydrolase n=1 Tax=Flammeovirga pacifica TaxID=915059 RepID=A0A1S1Z010_FLAPC|nr:glycoside hydrolase family 3 C-terminal domain-containing protein [Flammeovirga pacifica]OHX66591.1 glycosyl hydrolase [Flammeovirga pacifica]
MIRFFNHLRHFLILGVYFLFSGGSFAQTDKQTEEKINHIINQLTLEEKVALCHAQSKFSVPGVGRLGIPEIWMSDGPHGVRAEISWDSWDYAGWTNDSITAFPALTCLAASFNPEIAKDYGKAVGEEALYRKKDILLGPGVNIYRTPLNGRNFEYMGEDPVLSSTLVVPYIQGLQSNGVAACLKHFVANNQEHQRMSVDVEMPERALREIYLPAFKAAVQEANVWSIMSAYNQFRGQYCSHNEYLVNDILKGEWGFDGALITDWGAAHDSKQAALYGLDIEMGTGTNGFTYSAKDHYENYYLAGAFKELLKKGEVPEEVLDDKVRRVLRLMYRTSMNKERGYGSINTKSHHEVARKIGQEGIVLLQNEDNFFPLDPNTSLHIAVIGDNATRMMTKGGGSSELKPEFEVSPLQGLQERFTNANITYARGYSAGPPVYEQIIPTTLDQDSLKRAAIDLAKQADIVLFIGGLNKNHQQDCEGGDRLSYKLPYHQEELIDAISKVNKNTGVVIISGNAVETEWSSNVKGILQGWYLGSETGHALSDIISGDVNPSGKLPFTFPVKLKDNPAHHYDQLSYPGDGTTVNYKEGILVGYRWHDTKKITPKYAFGYGLSYTKFDINSISINKKSFQKEEEIKVTCSLTNIGETTGSEVVQVYVGKPKSKVERALKELKSFQKVSVNKGETKELTLSINAQDLKYYDTNQKAWVLEEGEYYIYVGNASNNITKRMKVTITDKIN